jgi:hypothetical protein
MDAQVIKGIKVAATEEDITASCFWNGSPEFLRIGLERRSLGESSADA